MKHATSIVLSIYVFALIFCILSGIGYWTHVVHCVHTHQWLRLITGCILAPFGAVDGWGTIFHWWN